MDPKARYEKERSDGKLQRLQSILDAAETIFIVRGIEKTTMQHIATEANIGIATLFRYFPMKEKLIVAVATKLLEPIYLQFQSIADLPLTRLEKLEKLFSYFMENHNKPSIKFMVDFESYAAHSLDPLEDILMFNSFQRKISREFARISEQDIDDGSIRSDLPVKESLTTIINAFALFSRQLSLQKNILLLESDMESERQLEILKQIFLAYIKAR